MNVLVQLLHFSSVVFSTIGGLQCDSNGCAKLYTDGIQGGFNNPNTLIVDSTGRVHVADSGNNATRRGTPLSNGSYAWETTGSDFNWPVGIASNSDGSLLFVSDSKNNAIRMGSCTSHGCNWTLVGGANCTGVQCSSGWKDGYQNEAAFNGPRGICIDGALNVYVTDFLNSAIRKGTLQVDGTYVWKTIGGTKCVQSGCILGWRDGVDTYSKFNWPHGIAIDSMENVYVADNMNNAVRRGMYNGSSYTWVTIGGTQCTSVSCANGSADGPLATFNIPKGVAIDAFDNVYVADSGNDMIRVYNSTMSGWMTIASGLKNPHGIAVNDALYIANFDENTVKRTKTIFPPPQIPPPMNPPFTPNVPLTPNLPSIPPPSYPLAPPPLYSPQKQVQDSVQTSIGSLVVAGTSMAIGTAIFQTMQVLVLFQYLTVPVFPKKATDVYARIALLQGEDVKKTNETSACHWPEISSKMATRTLIKKVQVLTFETIFGIVIRTMIKRLWFKNKKCTNHFEFGYLEWMLFSMSIVPLSHSFGMVIGGKKEGGVFFHISIFGFTALILIIVSLSHFIHVKLTGLPWVEREKVLETFDKKPLDDISLAFKKAKLFRYSGVWVVDASDTAPHPFVSRWNFLVSSLTPNVPSWTFAFTNIALAWTGFLLGVFAVPCACGRVSFLCGRLQPSLLIVTSVFSIGLYYKTYNSPLASTISVIVLLCDTAVFASALDPYSTVWKDGYMFLSLQIIKMLLGGVAFLTGGLCASVWVNLFFPTKKKTIRLNILQKAIVLDPQFNPTIAEISSENRNSFHVQDVSFQDAIASEEHAGSFQDSEGYASRRDVQSPLFDVRIESEEFKPLNHVELELKPNLVVHSDEWLLEMRDNLRRIEVKRPSMYRAPSGKSTTNPLFNTML